MDINSLSILYENDSARYFNAVYTMCWSKNYSNLQNNDQIQTFINFYRYFVSWFVPLLVIFGEIGTLLCLIVLLRRRTGSAETRLWFVALSLSDMYTLGVGLCMLYASRAHFIFPWLTLYDARDQSSFNCFFINGMVYFGLLLSTWIQVGISVLRVISVKNKRPTSNKPKTMYYVVALGVCIFSCLLITILKIGLSLEFDYTMPCPLTKLCKLKKSHTKSFFYVSLCIKVLLPTIALVCCSIIIINHLKKFKRKFSDRNNNSNANNSSISSTLRKRVKQKQISYTLLGMNFTFFLLTLPFDMYKIFIFNMDPQPYRPEYATLRIIDKLLNILLYANNATNWLFYFMLGQRFRQNVVSLLWRSRHPHCVSFWSTMRRWNSSLRTHKRTTRSTRLQMYDATPASPLPPTPLPRQQPPQGAPPMIPPRKPEEVLSLLTSEPRFHCTYPGGNNNLFPKFY